MAEKAPKPHWMVWQSRALCAGVLLLLPALYFGSYRLLLTDEPPPVMPSLAFVIIPPYPKPCYREEYAVGGEGVRLFYWPANRLHRLIDRHWPDG